MCAVSVVNCVAFHPEGNCVASGSADRTLKMWDTRSHLLIQHYPAHEEAVTSISMHPVGGDACCLTLNLAHCAPFSAVRVLLPVCLEGLVAQDLGSA